MRFVLLFFLLSAIHVGNAQDTVQKMNGKVIIGTILDTTAGDITISSIGKKKTRKIDIERMDIFSYRINGQPETIMYSQDSTIGNFLTVNEQRYFIFGERDAHNRFNPIGLKLLSGAFVFGVSVFDTYGFDTTNATGKTGFFRASPGLAPLVACIVIPVISRFTTVQLNLNKVSHRRFLEHEAYLDGFGEVARYKKVVGSLKFSVGGLLLGLGTYYLVNAIR